MASILVVCTGNVCRSPMAEGFLREALEERFGSSAPSVASAGIAGWEGSPAMPESVQAAAERGVDISAHRGRRLKPSDIEGADLVLAMAAEHREAVLRLVPSAEPRTFTLKELVRLLERLPPTEKAEGPRVALRDRVEEAARLRQSGFEGNPLDEDVADPLGMPVHTYRAVAWELEDLMIRLADGAFGAARSPIAPPRGGKPA